MNSEALSELKDLADKFHLLTHSVSVNFNQLIHETTETCIMKFSFTIQNTSSVWPEK